MCMLHVRSSGLWTWGDFPRVRRCRETGWGDRREGQTMTTLPCSAHTHTIPFSKTCLRTQRGTPNQKIRIVIKQITSKSYKQLPRQTTAAGVYCGTALLSSEYVWLKCTTPSPSIHFHFLFEVKGGFLWFTTSLVCCTTSQDLQMCTDPSIVTIFEACLVSGYLSRDQTVSSFDMSATITHFHQAITSNSPCLLFFCFVPAAASTVRWHLCSWAFSLFLPHESSAGSFSPHGNSCRSSEGTRCQTWVWTQEHKGEISSHGSHTIGAKMKFNTRNHFCEFTLLYAINERTYFGISFSSLSFT